MLGMSPWPGKSRFVRGRLSTERPGQISGDLVVLSKRQHVFRRKGGGRRRLRRRGFLKTGRARRTNRVGANGSRNILEPLLAEVGEIDFEPTPGLRVEACETQTPPGSAIASMREATLTTSPKTSPPLTITSPTLMPIRKSILSSSGTPRLLRATSSWIARAQPRAATVEGNSKSMASPTVLTVRPPAASTTGEIAARVSQSRRTAPSSSRPVKRL